jgi:hypothetical protein
MGETSAVATTSVAAATSAGETSAAAIFRRAALLALFAALLLAGPASAQSLDEVASQLQSEHVYGEGTDALKAKIGDAPTFVAVIPASAVQGSAGRTLIALRQAVGVRGSYALLAGSEFRTLSDEFGDAAQVGDLLRAKYGTDTEAMLTAFVDRAAKERERSARLRPRGRRLHARQRAPAPRRRGRREPRARRGPRRHRDGPRTHRGPLGQAGRQSMYS